MITRGLKIKGCTEARIIQSMLQTALAVAKQYVRYQRGDKRIRWRLNFNAVSTELCEDLEVAGTLKYQDRQGSATNAIAPWSKFSEQIKAKKMENQGYLKLKITPGALAYKNGQRQRSEYRKYLRLTDWWKLGRCKQIDSYQWYCDRQNAIQQSQGVESSDGFSPQFYDRAIATRVECQPTRKTDNFASLKLQHLHRFDVDVHVELTYFYIDAISFVSLGKTAENLKKLPKSETTLNQPTRRQCSPQDSSQRTVLGWNGCLSTVGHRW